MRRGQTATITLSTNIPIEEIKCARVVIRQDEHMLVFEGDRIENISGRLGVKLTQNDTLSMDAGKFEIQLRVTDSDNAYASNIMTGYMEPSLDDEVLACTAAV